jgi:hypothetical protein
MCAAIGALARLVEVVWEHSGKSALRACSLGEDGGDAAQGIVGDGVTVGPVLPNVERPDAHPVFAHRGGHSVEAVDRVASSELFMGVTKIGDGPAVAFDSGASSLAGVGEVVLGPFSLTIGDVEVVAGGTSLPARSSLETTLCAGVATPRLHGACFRASQRFTIISGRCCDVDERRIRHRDCGGRVGPSNSGGGCRLFGGGEGFLSVGKDR